MPRRRRFPAISEYHLQQIDRAAWLLGKELSAAQLSLTPFVPHYDACSDLQRDIKRALNLLNGRPADYEKPHQAPMSGG
ncbi:hypothetical protein DPM33_32935 [Mesorhizobium hawassense]|uniref:Uncharacterized protein n=1 Tax=Mesorhizobium hawassense TaxID=1209954 RepID=A0A330H4A6_9HYPH|nr:hypothetical protein [Mesorhizobium hawassense]RAZ83190.1 hypothetical protein DPM33_32935 [Mesorhizobium hawassense]